MNSTSNIAVIGAGSMGLGIAEVAARAGHPVFLWDAFPQPEKGMALMRKHLEKSNEKLGLGQEWVETVLNRVTWVDAIESLPACALIIEAVPEQPELKHQIFAQLEAAQPQTCILATNTSSLSVAGLSGKLKHADRFLGLHFFNPAFLMPLVEVVPGVLTRPGLAEELSALMRTWDKLPVLAKDTPGFIVNRVARPFYGESIRILEEGLGSIGQIDATLKEKAGFKMGPFELMDFIGHDVNFTVTATVFREFWCDPRYKPSFTQQRLMEAGQLGRKSGRGFYDYSNEGPLPQQLPDEATQELILNRVLPMLMNEAIEALHLGIASAPDLDLAMTKGVNYPKGLLQWADEWGADRVLQAMETLFYEFGEDRYRPSPLLRKAARHGFKLSTYERTGAR
ncbi:MAG: 3-hydroxyacyl-CoA dehydrogenase NAD-binding domain-containing protein [Bacteroidia bacterium]|jgi:3-hydroxybutyryl-CoA dehydrogenase